jgi:uridine phosphorylase
MKSESELILNSKGNVYHLDLDPGMVAPVCITVGDPDRVAQVSKYFDEITYKHGHREFITHIGHLAGSKIMVISTGISTDNIDIVFNELDALLNIDMSTKTIKEKISIIKFIRIGTSGAFDSTIPVDSILINRYAVGLDSLMRFYPNKVQYFDEKWYTSLEPGFQEIFKHSYLAAADQILFDHFSKDVLQGITITCPGFYGPQGRTLRLDSLFNPYLLSNLQKLKYHGFHFTNFEMETAGIYGLAHALGHQAISANIILANRITGEFSKDPAKAIEHGIHNIMNRLKELFNKV